MVHLSSSPKILFACLKLPVSTIQSVVAYNRLADIALICSVSGYTKNFYFLNWFKGLLLIAWDTRLYFSIVEILSQINQ